MCARFVCSLIHTTRPSQRPLMLVNAAMPPRQRALLVAAGAEAEAFEPLGARVPMEMTPATGALVPVTGKRALERGARLKDVIERVARRKVVYVHDDEAASEDEVVVLVRAHCGTTVLVVQPLVPERKVCLQLATEYETQEALQIDLDDPGG